MIAIIDYGAGNAGSVKKAFDYLGVDSIITSDPQEIINADRVVFPGVGNFGEVMIMLKEKKLDLIIKNVISLEKPFLGICVGLQVLFEQSEESPDIPGLGIFKGNVTKFKQGKIPQIGWNNINSTLFGEGYTYFVNSFVVQPQQKEIIAATADYNGEFVAAIQKDNVWATQFHPEKSGAFGLKILQKFLGGT